MNALARRQQLAGLDTTQKVWRLYVEAGLTMQQVAEELAITKGAVSKALKRAETIGLEALKGKVEHHKLRTLERLEWAWRTSQAAWERSCEGSTSKTSSTTERGESSVRKATIRTDDRPGDPRYMAQALDALKGIRELLGLDAPTKLQITDPNRPYEDIPLEKLTRDCADLLKQAGLSIDTLLAQGPTGAQ